MSRAIPPRTGTALSVDYFDPERSREWTAAKKSLVAAKREATRFGYPLFRAAYGPALTRYFERAPGTHGNRKPWREIGVDRFRTLRGIGTNVAS